MLTVKLRNERTKRTRNVECVEVVSDAVKGMTLLFIKKPDGSSEQVEVVALAEASTDPGEFHVAFVENAQGSTIQVVRP